MIDQDYGKIGDQLTADYLRRYGFLISKTNYHSRYGEIDIVAQKEDLLLFVEVKTRALYSLVSPSEAVDAPKRRRIRMTALDFIRKTGETYRYRFDVCEVTVLPEGTSPRFRLNYIKGAFLADE